MIDGGYREHIDRLISEASGETVLNGSESHATIIIERMFAKAKKSVCILSRRFDPRIYGVAETVEQAALFLGERDRSAKVLLEKFDPNYWERHGFLKDLKDLENLEVRALPEHLHEIVDINFAVMGIMGIVLKRIKRNGSR